MNICKKCSATFPNRSQLSDGRIVNLSKRSYCLSCSPYRGMSKRRNRRLDKYSEIDGVPHKWCPFSEHWVSCSEFGSHTRNGKKQLQGYCKPCSTLAVNQRLKRMKRRAVEYKGDKCMDCEQQFPDYIYDFHHEDPAQKEFKFTASKSWNNLVKELDKCVLLCANCHRHRHHSQKGS